ncbi:hypothetical protein LTR08_005326 [Meristemomyces frigidus]|nr:hypothetical protein LTR08_005326 [Meristemomyces frigidus]
MFYDLNIPWAANDVHLPRTLAFLDELGYNVVALNHAITGKLPAQIACAIPSPLPYKDDLLPAKLDIRRRVTLTLTESYQNARLTELARVYDVLAVRPVDERTLQLACGSLDCDIISLDLSQRFPFYFKHKMLAEAIRMGKRFELCYSQGLLGDSSARRNLISNATQLIRATRGKGLIISSEAKIGAVGCRGPWDAINLAAIWGLSQERGFEAMSKEARGAVVSAQLKRTGYRGVVDVVYGGEKPAVVEKKQSEQSKGQQKGQQKKIADQGKQTPVAVNGQKRKADALGLESLQGEEKPMSKRQAKKRAHEARMSAASGNGDGDTVSGVVGVQSTEGNGQKKAADQLSADVAEAKSGARRNADETNLGPGTNDIAIGSAEAESSAMVE